MQHVVRARLSASLIALAFIAPHALVAQGPVLIEGFAARRESAREPLFGGLAISTFDGPLGVRLGGALNARRTDPSFGDEGCETPPCMARPERRFEVRAWTADADIVVAPFRSVGVARALLLGFSPYAFVGLGARGIVREDASDTSVTTASLGAGVHHRLIGPLVLGAEGRYRRALRSDSAITLANRNHVEFRLALGLSFGGRRRMSSAGAIAHAEAESCAGDCASRSIERRIFAERTASRVLDRADARVGDDADAFEFVQDVFAGEGVKLPESPRRLLGAGSPVPTTVGSLRAGDLLFFAADRMVVDHVAIYVGGNRVVHASGGRVRYDVLGEGSRGMWLAEHLVTARRVVRGDEMRVRPRHSY